jgi:predicted Zn-dependent peptidase
MQIISEPGCQVFKLVALFPIGRNLESKRALVQSVAAMMKKSTQKKTNKRLHEWLDKYSIQIEIFSTPTHFTAELYCHIQFLNQAIPIFFEILFQAKFIKTQWHIVRDQTMSFIEQQMKQTDFWADKLLSEHLLGKQHPLGYYSCPKDYTHINLEDIEHFYKEFLQTCKPQFFLAGDNTADALKLVNIELKNYRFSIRTKRKSISIEQNLPQMIERKLTATAQASVRLGQLFERKSFQDFQNLELLNIFLGGHYMSELMKLLRVELGLTYGVYSNLNHFPGYSVFYIGFETDKKNVAVALDAISNLFIRLKKEMKLKIAESAKEYYSQWSKNGERSLQEIMYALRMKKLGYPYLDYVTWVNSLENLPKSASISIKSTIFDFSKYSKTVVY